jgi:SAM-dependent methyltransferase
VPSVHAVRSGARRAGATAAEGDALASEGGEVRSGELPASGSSADEIWLSATWPFVRDHLPKSPARIAELGCGEAGGHLAVLLNVGYDAVGVDPEAPERPGYRRIAFEDYVPDAPLDAVIASLSLHHVADPGTFLDHVYGVLAPGGTAAGSGLPTGADKARQLVDFVTTECEELGHPCTEAAVEHALDCAARRMDAHDDERAVLVHGDIHQLNALQVPGRDTFKLVDPDGLHAEAECELGVMMRNDPMELLDGDPWARAHWLAERCGLDARAIWEWGVVERVTSGLRAPGSTCNRWDSKCLWSPTASPPCEPFCSPQSGCAGCSNNRDS